MTQLTLRGRIVDTDRNEWAINGKTGVAYAIFVRSESASERDSAQRVRVSAEQFGSFAVGELVTLPVDVFANTIERGGIITGAKLSVTLGQKYVKAAQPKAA
jgi:hypothetical protein